MSPKSPKIHVVGGGLAGCEAAFRAVTAGISTVIHEMRPTKMTGAHKTGGLAELVCSNSLKSLNIASAPGQLKYEMRALGSIILEASDSCRVPAGQALAVNREELSKIITNRLNESPLFETRSEEITELPSQEALLESGDIWIVATGPLTTEGLCTHIADLSEEKRSLHFYDAIAPIITTESVDMNHAFQANRYGKSHEGGSPDGDYLNLPLDKETYDLFIKEIVSAEKSELHDFENAKYFENCLPIEVLAERGHDTLRYGPCKPVGLTDPKTGGRAHAVIQLRMENTEGTMHSLVGFQTKMKWGEQKRVFSLVPALANAEFLRYGSVHKNTYFESPNILNQDLSLKKAPNIYLAGQMTGVEGYTESAAMGVLAGLSAAAKIKGQEFELPPKGTIIGALAHYITGGGLGEYQPMNANLGLLPAVQKRKGLKKPDRKAMQCRLAREKFKEWVSR